MRNFAKVMCMMLILLSLAVTAMASESSVVTQTRAITFHAERGIFLSAEIINPGTNNQILKVVLPDSTILYRDLSNNKVWKEQKANGWFLKSSTLTEEELNLLSGLNLDTGWFPPSFPVQVRFFLKVSTGTIVADLPGDVQLSYNDDEVQVGEQLDTWLKWVGDHGGGNLQMEGGIEFGAMWKVYVNLPWPLPDLNDSGYIPKIPNVDFGFFRDCGFTPFLLDNALSCNANISSTRLPIPSIGWEGIAALYVGADVAGEVTGTLSGTSVCGNNAYCIYLEGDEKYFPVQISNCQTSVGVENKYNSSFRLRWEVSLTPTGCLDLFLLPDICFDPYTLNFTIFNQNLPLDFNRPNIQFQIEGQVPSTPGRPTASTTTPCANTNYTISWSSVSGATSYRLYENGNQVYEGTSRSRTFSHSSGSYSYYVRAGNNCGWSDNSSSQSVSIQPVPSTPSYVSPADGSTNQTQPVYLDWGNVSGADQYQVQVDNNSNFSSPEKDAQPTSSNYSASGLADGTQYWWRVRAHNSCGWGSWNSGTWDFTTDNPTSVEEIDSPELPEHFVLFQNYPNPFNPETKIEFALPRGSFVTIDVYNIVGKRVRNLANERLSAGRKVVTWDGRDDNGQLVSSGIYFYRIVTDSFTESKKMVLLK